MKKTERGVAGCRGSEVCGKHEMQNMDSTLITTGVVADIFAVESKVPKIKSRSIAFVLLIGSLRYRRFRGDGDVTTQVHFATSSSYLLHFIANLV